MDINKFPAFKKTLIMAVLGSVTGLIVCVSFIIQCKKILFSGEIEVGFIWPLFLLFLFSLMGVSYVFELKKLIRIRRRIKQGKFVLLQALGTIERRGTGKGRSYHLHFETEDKKIYRSENFTGKLNKIASYPDTIFTSEKQKANFERLQGVCKQKFNIFVDMEDENLYFIDISPLYEAVNDK